MDDIQEKIQDRAEELAEDEFEKDYYDLTEEQQKELIAKAAQEIMGG